MSSKKTTRFSLHNFQTPRTSYSRMLDSHLSRQRMSDLTFLSASQIAEQIRTRKIFPVEVIETHLARIENLNPKINAFVQIDRERAVAQARQAETAVIQGKSLGPLHGVPISIKS